MKTDALSKSGSSQKKNRSSAELAELEEKALSLAKDAKSENTKKAYKKDFEIFGNWANGQSLDSIPADTETIVLYITHMNELGRAPATITRVLSAISQAHKLYGFSSPTSQPQVSEVLKGIRRQRGTAQRQAKPLLAVNLKKIIQAIPPDMVGARDRALLLVGWSAALRRSELVGLDVEDLEYVEQGVIITIQRSKGDQEGAGQKVGIPKLDTEFCPVRALDKWRKLAKLSQGPLFCQVGYAGKNTFFNDIDNTKRLGGRSVSLIVKKYVRLIGFNADQYSAHSLRAGWTTSAAAVGAPAHVMMQHTRHKSLKTMHGYIREGTLFTDSPLALLL